MSHENIKDFLQLKNKIVKSIIKDIFKNKILCNRNGEILNEQDLLDILSNKIDKCSGITINNNMPVQCTKNVLFNGYCKHHNKKYEHKNNLGICMEEDNTIEFEIENENDNDNDNHEITTRVKKFINDSFYYVDDHFIYLNNSSNIKVGYIKNDEYIMSDDPFILDDNFIYLNNSSNTKIGYFKNDEYILSDDPFMLNTTS